MLKKLCCCVLAALLLSACAAPENKEILPTPTMAQEVLLPAATPAPTPVPTAGPQAEPAPSGILDAAEAVEGNAALRRIPLEVVGQGVQQKLLLHQGSLLVFGIGAECSLKQLSLDTGEVLNERTFAGFEVPHIEPCGDALALTDWADGDILLLDESLQTVAEYKVEASYGAVCLSPDGEKAYSFSTKGIRMTETAIGESAMLPVEGAMFMASEICDGGVAFSYTENSRLMNREAMLDLTGGKIVGTPFAGAVYGAEYRDGVWFAGEMGEDNAYLVYEGGELRRFALGETGGFAMLLDGAPHIMAIRYGENGAAEYALYAADGSFLSRCLQPTNTAISDEPVWSEADNGYFLIFSDWEKGDGLYFWDLSVQQAGEPLAMHPKEEENLMGEAVDAALYERAVQLGEQYGFTMKIAELTDTRFSDHTAEQVLDEATISAALDILEEALSAYPAGYTRQLTYGTQYEVEIQLIGSTWRDGAGDTGFTDFSAFTDIQAGRTVVALDINRLSGLEQTFHHELAHVADDRLQLDAHLRDDALYSVEAWEALNPSGFAYTNDYYTMPEEGHEDWFINLYAQTFAKEDFARTMEYAMMGRWDVFEGHEGRTAKLEYLCRCLRDGFDTAGWPEQTVWEQTLYEARQ